MNRFLGILFLFSFLQSWGQAKLRKLPTVINHPAINTYAPYISLDGNSLIFVSDNAEDNTLTQFLSFKKDGVNWSEPEMMPKNVNSRLNFLKGYALNADGSTLYLTSLKSGGLGGFDILTSLRRGTQWTEPVNLGLPVNSRQHEGCPSLSADETALYFMRCDKMDQKSAQGCSLWVSKKSRLGKWEEPTPLPDFINTGNSQVPRILGDGETLIFSSDKFPQNKGGMDLYFTRLQQGQWSKPLPLSFANSTKDDQYVSASSLGRYLLADQPGQRKNEIVEVLFPPELKPKALARIEGVVSGLADPTSAYIAVFNLQGQNWEYNGRPDKNGEFVLYLKEGAQYDLSVEPGTSDYTFDSKRYDFTEKIPLSDKVELALRPVAKGTVLDLEGISFKPFASSFSDTSSPELKRLARMVKGNSNHTFQIEVALMGYQSDTVQSHQDLTELIIDTIRFTVERRIPDTHKVDSLMEIMNSELEVARQTLSDSVYTTTFSQMNRMIDSVRQHAFLLVVEDSVRLRKTFHNDRTKAQAKAIANFLDKEGASPDKVQFVTRAVVENVAGEKTTKVRLTVVD